MRISDLVKEYRRPREDGHVYVGLDPRLLDAMVALEAAVEALAADAGTGPARRVAKILDGEEG